MDENTKVDGGVEGKDYVKREPYEIVMYPDKRLYQRAEEVAIVYDKGDKHKETVEILNRMMQTLKGMTYGDRLGLAAPQVGVQQRIMIVLGVGMINPEWHPVKGMVDWYNESCYSLGKDTVYRKKRPTYGWAKWQDPITGEIREEKLTGRDALVFQHELDHLNGTLLDGVEWITKTTDWVNAEPTAEVEDLQV